MLFLNLHRHGFVLAELFWGLWLFPLALPVYRARFTVFGTPSPASPGWLSLTSVLFQQYLATGGYILSARFFWEIAFMCGSSPRSPRRRVPWQRDTSCPLPIRSGCRTRVAEKGAPIIAKADGADSRNARQCSPPPVASAVKAERRFLPVKSTFVPRRHSATVRRIPLTFLDEPILTIFYM
jgi:hypothetical protein